MLSFLLSPFAKVVGGLMLVGALGIGIKVWFVEHDKAVVAGVEAAQSKALLASMQADYSRVIAALQTQTAEAATQAASLTKAKEAVAHAPQSTSCVNSPAMLAALGSLRHKPAGSHNGSAAKHSGVVKNVQAAAGTSGK